MAAEVRYTEVQIKLFVVLRTKVLHHGFLTNNEELALRGSCRVAIRTVNGYYDDNRRACQERARAGCLESQRILREFEMGW